MAGVVLIEAVEPIQFRSRADGLAYALQPGQRVALPSLLADRLLAAAPELVRLVEAPIQPGCRVAWESPLFGHLEALALAVTDRTVLVRHPLTEQTAVLPRSWVRGVEEPG